MNSKLPKPRDSPWLEALVRARPELDSSVNRTIHPMDEMLEVGYLDSGGDFDAALVSYFASGAQVASSIDQLVQTRFAGELDGLLDFGGGFGRVTRFLASRYGPERIWASDIVPETIPFQSDVLGTTAFLSAQDPATLTAPRRFDLIYVGSLFTHLPDSTFGSWLERLRSWLTPEGLLAFTVHDEALLPPEHSMPPEGIFFKSSSESRTISHDVYGSTWVTERYVAQQLARLGGLQWRVIQRGICGYQTLVLVADAHSPSLSTIDYDEGAQGQIESATIRGDKHDQDFALELEGWSWHPAADRHEVERIEVTVERGALVQTSTLSPRPDLVAALEQPGALLSGWQLDVSLDVPLSRSRSVIVIDVVSSGGARTLLFCGSLERLLYACAAENFKRHRQRVYELAEIIEAMKESVFWRARARWFRVKRALGLTDEDPSGPPITANDRRPDDSESSL